MSNKKQKKEKNSEDEDEECKLEEKNSIDQWSNSEEELASKKIKKPKKVSAIKTDNEIYFNLNSKKRVTVRKYRGQVLIDFREFWEKNNEQLPTKKGISLTEDGWKILKKIISEIDEAIETIK